MERGTAAVGVGVERGTAAVGVGAERGTGAVGVSVRGTPELIPGTPAPTRWTWVAGPLGMLSGVPEPGRTSPRALTPVPAAKIPS